MPWDEVLPKWKAGTLRSGGPEGPKVGSQAQAVAIMLSEKKKALGGQKEYQPINKKGIRHPGVMKKLGKKK